LAIALELAADHQRSRQAKSARVMNGIVRSFTQHDNCVTLTQAPKRAGLFVMDFVQGFRQATGAWGIHTSMNGG